MTAFITSFAPCLLLPPTSHSLAQTARPPRSRAPPPRCCDTAPTSNATPENIERLFNRLSHVSKTVRKKASYELSELAHDDEIDRLLALLEEEETSYRRSAVQTLGMIGLPVVSKLVDLLRSAPNSTVRASCAKALAAVSLYYPDCRAEFPPDAVNRLAEALAADTDPVTKLSVVGCLGSLGCDSRDGQPGNKPAIQALKAALTECFDMAVGTTVVSALAQIGQNGSPELKADIINVLQGIVDKSDNDDSDNDDSALKYVKEIAVGHIDQLSNQMSVGVPPSM